MEALKALKAPRIGVELGLSTRPDPLLGQLLRINCVYDIAFDLEASI